MKYLTVVFAASLTVFASCSKWLDVSPVDEVSKEDMYATTDGFYNVLNGIYLDLGSDALYGKNLSWGAMEVWSRTYKLKPNFSSHEKWISLQELKYDERGVKSMGESIWQGMYKNIARLNEFLQSCENREDGFFRYGEVEKNLLMGEAYALRAYIHFDLFRIFGQTMATQEGKETAYIPYVDKYPSKVNVPINGNAFIKKVEEDLEKASRMVAAYDTLENNASAVLSYNIRFSETEKPEWGRFYSQRGARMNYYAIKLLQERVAMYHHDYEKALPLAEEIIGLVNDKDLVLASSGTIATAPKMMNEVLFAFYNNKLIENTQDYFDRTSSLVFEMEDPGNFNKISSDKRKGLLMNNVLILYREDKNGSEKNYIPALRISEAYYTAAEIYANTGRLEEAITLFNTFLKARGIMSKSQQIQPGTSLEDFLTYLQDDARKEFAGLGQNIFMYKRLNVPVRYSGGVSPATVGHLRFPVPETENAI